MIVATLVLGALPAPLVPVFLGAQHSRPAEAPPPENSREEQADSEKFKAYAIGRRLAQVSSARGWFVRRVPRLSASRPRPTPLTFEDPRRVLLPLRIDPPPEDLA